MVRERGARGEAWTLVIVLAVGAALTLASGGSAENRQIRPRPPRPPARRDPQKPKPPPPKPPVKDIPKSKRPLPGKTPAAGTVKGRTPKLPLKDAKKKGHTHKRAAVPTGKKVGHTKGHGASSKARPHLQFSLLSDTRANLYWNTSKDIERYALFRGGPRRHDATPLQVFDNSRHVHPKLHRYIGNLKPGVPSSFVLVAYRDRSDRTGTPSNVVIVRTGAKSATGSLPEPGPCSYYPKDEPVRVKLDGKQCVPAARALSEALNAGRTFPALGSDGGPVDLWNKYDSLDRFTKVPYTGTGLPPQGALLIWKAMRNNKYGHIAFVLGVTPTGAVRVVDANWHRNKGWIRDVTLSEAIYGWFAPN